MSTIKKLIAVTNDEGRLVGTGIPCQPQVMGPKARICAKPGQTLHEIEINVPERFASEDDVERFHRSVHQHLKERGLV